MLNFYVYVDGSDLDRCQVPLIHAFTEFSARLGPGATVINDLSPPAPDQGCDDLPDWNLGLNFSTTTLSEAVAAELVSFLIKLSQQTEREFVIGLWYPNGQVSDDLMFIDTHSSMSRAAQLCLMVEGR